MDAGITKNMTGFDWYAAITSPLISIIVAVVSPHPTQSLPVILFQIHGMQMSMLKYASKKTERRRYIPAIKKTMFRPIYRPIPDVMLAIFDDIALCVSEIANSNYYEVY